MNVKLVGVDPVSAGVSLEIRQWPTVIGRGEEASLRLDDRFASRRHCELAEEEGRVVVRDLASRHGVYVNGRQVDQAVLAAGDTLQVGLTRLRADFF